MPIGGALRGLARGLGAALESSSYEASRTAATREGSLITSRSVLSPMLTLPIRENIATPTPWLSHSGTNG